MKYHALGPITRTTDVGVFNDSTDTDALGNMHQKLHYWTTTDVTTAFYDSLSSILNLTTLQHSVGSVTPDSTIYTYDLAGSGWQTSVLTYVKDSACGGICVDHLYNRRITKMRYGPDLKMMMSDTHLDEYSEWTQHVVGVSTYDEREEYRMDALGRRVWKRLVRPDQYCQTLDRPSGCLSTVERTVWDGDQVLAEVRADGGETATESQMDCDNGCSYVHGDLEGIVLYTLGGGLDHPLDIYRGVYNDVVVPEYSWRGRAVDGVCVSGSQFCTDFAWPGRTEGPMFEPAPTDPAYGGPIAWGGNIIDTQEDGSGLIYKRNRYYDPQSGRFTQVDPIGLGGGLSAYGFGGGDQVSFGDPFGLCKGVVQAPTAPCAMIAILLGEDNSHGKAGYDAVASVIMNRATGGKWAIKGKTLHGKTGDAGTVSAVIAEPTQFAGTGTKAYKAAVSYPTSGKTNGQFSAEQYEAAAASAEAHFQGNEGDTTDGALFFFQDHIPNTSWGQKAIDKGKAEVKNPTGYQNDKAHNNIFWGPIQ